MKNRLFFALLLLLVFSFVACEDDESDDRPDDGNIPDGDMTDGDFAPDGDADRGDDGDVDGDANSEDIVPSTCVNAGTPGATAGCLAPTQSDEYYIEQSLKYFDTLDIDASPESIPNYSDLVARWEWPPWLLLTGYGKETMISASTLLRQFDPSTVPERECRAFDTQPFGRCYVVFEYEGRPCPIYEEFTFNDRGEMTFIEAWSDLPGMRPMQLDDRWAEAPGIARLSTRIPGLGNAEGRIDLDSTWMEQAARQDVDVADFRKRARDQWTHWLDTLLAAENLYERGCGWPVGPENSIRARL